MSLFPAYSDDPVASTSGVNNNDPDWLTNESFKVKDLEAISAPTDKKLVIVSDEEDEPHRKSSKKHKKDKKKKSKKEREPKIPERVFTGKEDYYVDKIASKNYLKVDTLHRPVRPKFYSNFYKILGGHGYANSHKTFKRYYKEKIQHEEIQADNDAVESEMEFVLKTKEFNEYLADYPSDIPKWLEFVELQNSAGVALKLSKTQLADKKCDVLERALKENCKNDELVNRYLDTIVNVFPDDEVAKRIEKLLSKDSANYILWKALINATQGSMARCYVPDVLKLYEKCMQTLYNKLGDENVMIDIFYKCALFLRQCGLYEQFFALIKFTLELNLSADKLDLFMPRESDENVLIEYEEVVLKSGLPMNELWLRVEKLRQNFNFLPCPENYACSDPQRIIPNEDISNFIYPTGKYSNLSLTFSILKLLKVPFLEEFDVGANQVYTDEAEFDDIEKLLSVLLENSVGNPLKYERFNRVLLEFIKEFNVGPSYLAKHIGHELYHDVIVKLLVKLYELTDHTAYVMLWVRYEHLILKINHENSATAYASLQVKIKAFLKANRDFRNNLNFFILYTKIIYENEGFVHYQDIIDKMLMSYHYRNGYDEEITNFLFSYIEVLLLENKNKMYTDRILKILIIMILDAKWLNNLGDDLNTFELTDSRKLLALTTIENKFKGDLNNAITVQYKMYLNILIKNQIENFDFIMRNLDSLEMKFYEIFFKSIELIENNYNSQQYLAVLKCGVNKYPKNLILLRYLVLIENRLLYKIKNLLDNCNKNSIFVIFLVAMFQMHSRSGSIEGDQYMNVVIKNRIKNLLKSYLNDNSERNKIKKNSIIWRLYLKFIYNCEENLSELETILYKSLDECPWMKSLYMDGAIYVPQNMAQLQDLIIEKQLRIYALPEELEVLRDENLC